MAADNDLTKAAEGDKMEMSLPDLSPDINVVIQYDPGKAHLFDFFENKPTTRFKITDHQLVQCKELGETNTGDPSVLKDFLEWGMKRFEAKRSIVILWSHGCGVKDLDIYQSVFQALSASLTPPREEGRVLIKSICPDDKSRDALTISELGEALAVPGKKIDILIFDACLMNMFEVVYQVRDCTDMVIGSEATIPTEGLPYKPILDFIGAHPDAGNDALADIIVTSFKESFPEPKDLITLSAIRTSSLENTSACLDEFAKTLCESLTEIRMPLWKIQDEIQKFGEVWQHKKQDYIDLYQFVSLCRDRLPQEDIRKSAESLLTHLDEIMVCCISEICQDKQKDNPGANGISIYFPWQRPPENIEFKLYRRLDFSIRHPHWLKLIMDFHS